MFLALSLQLSAFGGLWLLVGNIQGASSFHADYADDADFSDNSVIGFRLSVVCYCLVQLAGDFGNLSA
jgi:hypothetical protein